MAGDLNFFEATQREYNARAAQVAAQAATQSAPTEADAAGEAEAKTEPTPKPKARPRTKPKAKPKAATKPKPKAGRDKSEKTTTYKAQVRLTQEELEQFRSVAQSQGMTLAALMRLATHAYVNKYAE